MSYDIQLTEPVGGETIQFDSPHFMTGGTYQLGGTREAWLNITYNYAPFYYNVFGNLGIRTLYGRTGAESVPMLKQAINALDDNISNDYWDATEGNAKKALCSLLAFAQMRPDGIWEGD